MWLLGGGVATLVVLGILGAVFGGDKPAAPDDDYTSSGSSATATAVPTTPREDFQRQQAERAAQLDPASYTAITPRDFALLVKDPIHTRARRSSSTASSRNSTPRPALRSSAPTPDPRRTTPRKTRM